MDDLDMIGLLVDYHLHRLKRQMGDGAGGGEDEDDAPVPYGVE